VLTKQLAPEGLIGEETNKETLRLPTSPVDDHEVAGKSTQRQLDAGERDIDGQESTNLANLKSSKLDQIVTSGSSFSNPRKGSEVVRPDREALQTADANKEAHAQAPVHDHLSQIRQKVALKSVITTSDSPQQLSFPSPQSPDQLKITQPRQLTADCTVKTVVQSKANAGGTGPELIDSNAKLPAQRQATRYGYIVPYPGDRPSKGKLIPKHTNRLNLEFSRDLPQDLHK